MLVPPRPKINPGGARVYVLPKVLQRKHCWVSCTHTHYAKSSQTVEPLQANGALGSSATHQASKSNGCIVMKARRRKKIDTQKDTHTHRHTPNNTMDTCLGDVGII